MSITSRTLLSSPWPKKEDMLMTQKIPEEKQSGESQSELTQLLILRTSHQNVPVISTVKITGSRAVVMTYLGRFVQWSSIQPSIVVLHERLSGYGNPQINQPQITFVPENNTILIYAKEIQILTNLSGDGCPVLADYRS